MHLIHCDLTWCKSHIFSMTNIPRFLSFLGASMTRQRQWQIHEENPHGWSASCECVCYQHPAGVGAGGKLDQLIVNSTEATAAATLHAILKALRTLTEVLRKLFQYPPDILWSRKHVSERNQLPRNDWVVSICHRCCLPPSLLPSWSGVFHIPAWIFFQTRICFWLSPFLFAGILSPLPCLKRTYFKCKRWARWWQHRGDEEWRISR